MIKLVALLLLLGIGSASAQVNPQALVNAAGAGAPLTQVAVTCTSTSGALLAAGTAHGFVRVVNPTGSAATIFVRWDGATATAAVPAEAIPAGGSVTWSGVGGGYFPTGTYNCITASTSAAVIVEYN